jgi:hypothetical protein
MGLRAHRWDLSHRQAELLQRDERPCPYVEFVAARGKALASWGAGDRSPATLGELARLDRVARTSGLGCQFPSPAG